MSLFDVAYTLKYRGIQDAYSILLSKPKINIILYGESGYNWDDALPELYRAGFNVIRVDNNDMLLTNPGKIFGKYHPAAFLYGIHTKYTHLFISEAHRRKIPVVSWQHGASGMWYHPTMAGAEYASSGYHLVFGEAAASSYKETCRRSGLPNPPEFIPIGSSSLDRLKKKFAGSPEETTLYMFQSYLSKEILECDGHPVDHNARLFHAEMAIIDYIFAHYKNPVFKLHPYKSGFDYHEIIAHIRIHPNPSRIVRFKPMGEDTIYWAKIAFFDAVDTAILQAITKNIPVIVYTGVMQNDDIVLRLLRKRATVMGEPWELKDIDPGQIRFKNNQEFLEQFGTFKNDGKSADRAISLLKKVIEG